MMPAQYFCSGEVSKEEWHHYGLAAPVYTHFTSPIRRYADVIVHRLLAASIGVISLPAANADRARQRELCSHMNRRHKAAQQIQRASVNIYTLLFFKDRPCREPAYILKVQKDCVVVMVPRFGIEGNILLTLELGGKVEVVADEFNPSTHTVVLTVQGQKHELKVFNRVTVYIRVVEQDAGGRKLVLNLLTPDGIFIGSSPPKTEPTVEVRKLPGENSRSCEDTWLDSSSKSCYEMTNVQLATAVGSDHDDRVLMEVTLDDDVRQHADESAEPRMSEITSCDQIEQKSSSLRLKALRPPSNEKKRLIGRLIPPGSKRKLRQKLR